MYEAYKGATFADLKSKVTATTKLANTSAVPGATTVQPAATIAV